MIQIPLDLCIQIAEEFNVERAFVKVVSMEVMLSATFNPDLSLADQVRAKVKHALELIDGAES